MNKQSVIPIVMAALLLAACSQDFAEPLLPTSAVSGAVDTEQASSTTAAAPNSAAPTTSTASTTTTSLAEVPVQSSVEGLTVLYAGHSFGRPFAQKMDEATRLAEIEGHEQRVVFRGGEWGVPQAMWENPEVQSLIRKQLDDGAVDVVILICCSSEFRETAWQSDQEVSDQAILEIVAYALAQNSETRFGLAMPWADFPGEYATGDEHREVVDAAYPRYQQLADNISEASNGAEVFTFYHGAAVYELRSRFEQGLIPELTNLIGPKQSSVFTDTKGHAANMAKDAGTLIWLNAIYGIKPLDLPPIEGYAVDVREIAASALSSSL